VSYTSCKSVSNQWERVKSWKDLRKAKKKVEVKEEGGGFC
jgi:hypothetical protein